MKIRTMLTQYPVCNPLLPGLIAFALCLPASAAMYKWVDEEGNVHYTETKPEGDIDAEVIRPQQKADNTELERERSDRLAREKAYEEYRKEKEKEQEAIAKQEALREKNCKQSKELLEKLKSLRRFRIKDEEGNPKWASNEEHQATIDRVQQNVNEFCK